MCCSDLCNCAACCSCQTCISVQGLLLSSGRGCCVLLHVCPEQTIADMIVYNKSRREARNRLVARSWERPYLKFKVGTALQLTLEVHVLIGTPLPLQQAS